MKGSVRISSDNNIDTIFWSKYVRLILVAVLGSTLVACGGSGGSSGGATTPSSGDPSGGASGDPVVENFKDIGLVINELMVNIYLSDNPDNKSDFNWRRPWLELYNGSDAAIDLSGFKLSAKGIENTAWQLPDITMASGEYLRIWGTGFDRKTDRNDLHTSFPIMGVEVLSLVHKDSSILDRIEGISFARDQSWGRYPDGAKSYSFNDNPTPGLPNAANGDSFSLNCEDMTLTTGKSFQLKTSPSVPVTWASNSAKLAVSDSGLLTTTMDGIAGHQRPALITATHSSGTVRDCQVTVVNWTTNASKLTVMGNPRADFMLSYMDDHIYYTLPRELYRAEDGFKNDQKVGTFPYAPAAPLMFKTEYGYFASSGNEIYSTQDFNTWTPELTMQHQPLQHGFSHYFDNSDSTNYLYAGEYSVEQREPHAVYRGLNTGANTQWEKVLDWGPEQSFYDDNSRLNTIRHVHAVVTDPYTGHVWVATGDLDQHSRLYFSDDNGENFDLIALGSQKFRSLSLWFTEDYVYWNMDSERADQHVYRLPRTTYNANNTWPSLTPELSSGSTKAGVRYLVSSTRGGNFPVPTGQFFVETSSHSLSRHERVYAIEDPQYDYSESVANLTHASQWYHLWVKDQNDEDVLLMATSAEGTEPMQRDYNSRVFGFKERSDGTVDVQELLTLSSNTPRQPNRFTQLVPNMQDNEGYIYFRGRETAHRVYKTKLTWNDSRTAY